MAEKNGGTAFPWDSATQAGNPGLSLRDYFAGQALPNVINAADIQSRLNWAEWSAKVAMASYEIADAMLAERSK